MPVETKWKVRAAALCRVFRMLQGPALGVCWSVGDQPWEVFAAKLHGAQTRPTRE